MTAPLIPYVEAPELSLPFLAHLPVLSRLFDPANPPSIKPFGTLVAFGVYLGSIIAMRHGRQRGMDDKKLGEFIFFVIGMGFVGGHMLDAIFYHPHTLAADPLYLFRLWDGLSSYGGFIGSALAALAWRQVSITTTWKAIRVGSVTLFSVPTWIKVKVVRWRDAEPVLPMVEMINSAFPLSWVFGRMGCSSVHDHPGRLSDAWFALRWPINEHTERQLLGPLVFHRHVGPVAGRLDLGLIEMVLAIPLAVTFLVLWQRKPFRGIGFYTGWMCIYYAPIRFLLDFLRVEEGKTAIVGGDPRYGGLTPAQWACFGLLALGLWCVHVSRRKEQDGPAPPPGKAGEQPGSEPTAAPEAGEVRAGEG